VKRWLLGLLLMTGCLGALGDKPQGVALRYFSPEQTDVRAGVVHADASRAPIVRLGRVTSSESLGARIVHRTAAHEIAMYETLRWTDAPDVYVRRALTSALYETGAARDVAGDAPILDVEVTAFEEVDLEHGEHAGRVELHYELRDDRGLRTSGTTTATHAAQGDAMEGIVSAVSAAMDEAVRALVERTLAALR